MTQIICPQCRRPGGLKIGLRLEIPSDSRSDEISLQTLACGACGFTGVGVYEESRRGALDSEAWSHQAYRLEGAALRSFGNDLAACPEPGSPRCECATHRRYGKRDASGRWIGLQALDLGERFVLTIA